MIGPSKEYLALYSSNRATSGVGDIRQRLIILELWSMFTILAVWRLETQNFKSEGKYEVASVDTLLNASCQAKRSVLLISWLIKYLPARNEPGLGANVVKQRVNSYKLFILLIAFAIWKPRFIFYIFNGFSSLLFL